MDEKPSEIMMFRGRNYLARDGEVFEMMDDGTLKPVRPDMTQTEPVLVDVKPLSFVLPSPPTP